MNAVTANEITRRLSELPLDRQTTAIWMTFGAAISHAKFSPSARLSKFFTLLEGHVAAQEKHAAADRNAAA